LTSRKRGEPVWESFFVGEIWSKVAVSL
jgi:hypothetical protein